MREFFYNSDELDRLVLRPLSHIKPYWELTWDRVNQKYIVESGSFAAELNQLLFEIEQLEPSIQYHDNEDILAEYVRDKLKWPIRKEGNRWTGNNYMSIIEQGGFYDIDEQNLLFAATGRIKTAIKFGQKHFDDVEESHKIILANVLSVILYHRSYK